MCGCIGKSSLRCEGFQLIVFYVVMGFPESFLTVVKSGRWRCCRFKNILVIPLISFIISLNYSHKKTCKC